MSDGPSQSSSNLHSPWPSWKDKPWDGALLSYTLTFERSFHPHTQKKQQWPVKTCQTLQTHILTTKTEGITTISSHSRCNVHVSARLNSVGQKEPQWKGQDICALLEASYLGIYLFLLIINLDYSRHLKKGGAITVVKQQRGEEKKSWQHRQVKKIK